MTAGRKGRRVLEARNLTVRLGGAVVVDDVSLTLPPGPFGLGLIGASGSGKTTVARCLLRLLRPDRGTVLFDGTDVGTLRGVRRLRPFRRAVQVVHQDSEGALNPRMRVGAAIAEVLHTHRMVERAAAPARVVELLAEVGLAAEHADRFPHQLSGGQRQRAVIARALAVRPRYLVLDEPTSALDVTVQARVLELFERLRAEHQLSYLLVSHDLAVVERLCERVAVLHQGRVVEDGPTAEVLHEPRHEATRRLRDAVPRLPDAAPHGVAPGAAAQDSPAAGTSAAGTPAA